jgi:hypothetical protein
VILTGLKGDVENLGIVKKLNNKQFDLILCIESLHCIADIQATFAGVKKLMAGESAYFVVADLFDERQIPRVESIMNEYFQIEKKEIITINAKHAMLLDKERVENIVRSTSN